MNIAQDNKTKQFNRAKGNVGEGIAWFFLQSQGFNLVQSNYRNKHGEIDIVANKYQNVGKQVELVYHFVEVKFRLSDTCGLGREAVNIQKQRHIRSAAQYYLIENGLHDKVYSSFDVIEVTGTPDNPYIEFIENCF